MDPTTAPTLVDLLRSTLSLVKYYGNPAEHGPELDRLSAELQRAIAAIEATEANRRWLPASEGQCRDPDEQPNG